MSTRDDVLARLRAAGGAATSGEKIGRDLSISRAAVAKHVAALRSRGYTISAAPGSGYRLVSAPNLPVPAEVAPLVCDPLWVRIEGKEVTASTNDDARQLAGSGAPEGTVVVAGSQTAGRGRLGRQWQSPEGGVYLSMVFRPALAPASIAPLALVVGLGVIEALETFGVTARLKWPNDVLLDGGKVAGILLEMSAEADRVEWVVAGVGINVVPLAGSGVPGAAFLAADGSVPGCPGVSRPSVAAAVLDAVAPVYRRFLAEGFGPLAAIWNGSDALQGQAVVVRTAQGEEVAEGIAEGVDAEGRLLVFSDAGMTRVVAGEVTLKGRA